MIITMNQQKMILGEKYLGWLRESNDILDSIDDLHHRFEEDGYLLIRNLQPIDVVEKARQHLINQLSNQIKKVEAGLYFLRNGRGVW